MLLFAQSAFLQALGWSLIDSLWKMGSLWLVYSLVCAEASWLNSRTRYTLAVLLMLGGTIWSFTGTISYYQDLLDGKGISFFSVHLQNSLDIFHLAGELTPYLSGIYLVAILFLLVKLIYQYFSGRTALVKGLVQADEYINNMLTDLRFVAGVRKKTRIAISRFISTPLTTGFFKPLILLPVAALNQLSVAQTEAIITHELFHIRYHDYVVNLLVCIGETLLFFNPFSRLFLRAIKEERELACDESVLEAGIDKLEYASALYILGRNRGNMYSFSLAATGQRPLLLDRVRRILNSHAVEKNRSGLLFVAFKPVGIFFLCLAAAVFAGRPQKNDFLQAGVLVPHRQPTEVRLITPAELKNTGFTSSVHHKPATRRLKIRAAKPVIFYKSDESAGVASSYPVSADSLAFFASTAPEASEFTMSIPEAPVVPSVGGLQQPLPYVPSHTFYFSIVRDSITETGKITVHL